MTQPPVSDGDSIEEAYGFTWWGWLLFGLLTITAIGGIGLVVVVVGWLLVPLGPPAWIVVVPMTIWGLVVLVAYLALYTPVIVGEHGFRVRVILWWTEIGWSDVIRLSYSLLP
jgi:hypothetical protein